MLKEIKIKLELPFLGAKEDGSGVKRFERTKSEDLVCLSNDVLKWAVEESLLLLQLDQVINPDFIVEILPIKRPSFVLYNRKYKDKTSGTVKSVGHEAIRSGCILTMDLLLLNKIPGKPNKNLRAPSDSELHQIFTAIGKFFGLSPWGSHTGKYGRFELLTITEKNTTCPGTEEKATNQGA